MKKTYDNYKHLKTWEVLKNALVDLEKNRDFERKTQIEYIVGYLLKSLIEAQVLTEKLEE